MPPGGVGTWKGLSSEVDAVLGTVKHGDQIDTRAYIYLPPQASKDPNFMQNYLSHGKYRAVPRIVLDIIITALIMVACSTV